MHPNSTIALSAHARTRRALLKAAPLAVMATACPTQALSLSRSDASIVEAWDERLAAYMRINAGAEGSAEREAWAVVDACEKVIEQTSATTPQGIEIQIWTALHNSSAYTRDEEAAILRRDIEWIDARPGQFDWDATMMVAAIRSIRMMGGL